MVPNAIADTVLDALAAAPPMRRFFFGHQRLLQIRQFYR
jgi:hypothetical protein